jgi:hypothetical protein
MLMARAIKRAGHGKMNKIRSLVPPGQYYTGATLPV